MKKISLFLTISLLSSAFSSASASLTITGREIGNDVIFNYEGSINTGALNYGGAVTGSTKIESGDDELSSGGTGEVWYVQGGFTVSGSMGTGKDVYGQAGGDTFAIYSMWNNMLYLPTDYISGTTISGTITFDNHTFASLQITENNIATFSWGTDGNADSIIFSTVTEHPEFNTEIEAAIKLSWQSRIGSRYRIEVSSTMESDDWQVLKSGIQGTGSRLEFFDCDGLQTRFYRVKDEE